MFEIHIRHDVPVEMLLERIIEDIHEQTTQKKTAFVSVSFEGSHALKLRPLPSKLISEWDLALETAKVLDVKLKIRPPRKVVLETTIDISIPRSKLPESALEIINKDYGFEDGNIWREEKYPGEAKEYGRRDGALVPIKHPFPPGLMAAHHNLRVPQKQTMFLRLWNDGIWELVTKSAETP